MMLSCTSLGVNESATSPDIPLHHFFFRNVSQFTIFLYQNLHKFVAFLGKIPIFLYLLVGFIRDVTHSGLSLQEFY